MHKTAYELRISDWSSDVCSSDLKGKGKMRCHAKAVALGRQDINPHRMTSNLTVAFIGLGVMGGPMAGHLAASGHRVVAYNRTRSRAEAWHMVPLARGHAATVVATPAAAALRAQSVSSGRAHYRTPVTNAHIVLSHLH